MFKNFYETLNATKEYHLRYPHLEIVHVPDIISNISIPFSSVEIFGKYLDLHEFYLKYCNLPNIPPKDLDYLQYLDKFNSFFFINESQKGTKQYRIYLRELWEYLYHFFQKIQPLVDMNELIKEFRLNFEVNWSTGKVPGWKSSGVINKLEPQPIRLGMFNTVTELEALGMDRLKDGLEALGLKCGGTLKDRAQRLWSVRGKKFEDYPEKIKTKSVSSTSTTGQKRKADDMEGSESDDRRKQVEFRTFRSSLLLLYL